MRHKIVTVLTADDAKAHGKHPLSWVKMNSSA